MKHIKPFVMLEYDWAFDKESNRSVLVAPVGDGKIGVWYDVPEPIYSQGLQPHTIEMPDRVLPYSKDIKPRPDLCRQLLYDALQEVQGYGVGC